MQFLPKKKSEAAEEPLIPAWHPNLRIPDRLPDIKVVRTAFFVNGIAVALATAAALYQVSNEWSIHELGIQIDAWTRQIDKDRPASEGAVALYGTFKQQEAVTQEISSFVSSKPAVFNLFLRIGQTMPQRIAMDSLEMREGGVTLRATVRGAPDQASGDATAYWDQLRKDKELAPLFESIELTSLSRSPVSGRIAVEIYMQFKKSQGKKA